MFQLLYTPGMFRGLVINNENEMSNFKSSENPCGMGMTFRYDHYYSIRVLRFELSTRNLSLS